MAIKVIGKVSIVPQGEYQADTTYPRLSLVYYQGGSYIAVVESTNIVPTDTSSWQQVAAPGNGISSIEKISTVGLVDTYRITYTNGDHFDFTINNGATQTSELTNDSGFIDKDVNNLTNYLLKTSTGAAIEITYDSSAYTVTVNLKNSSGTTISTSTIQLPSGASIVNASYDEETYVITLAQRDGTEITLDLANSFNAKEDVENKIDELNGNATEDQYPNAQITYEKIHELQEQGVSQEAQGQEIFLYDSTNLPPKEIALSGNATQQTYTGKNLYDIQDLVKGRLDDGVIGYESGTESLIKNSDSYTMTTNANYRGASTEHYISIDSSTDYVLSFTTSSTTSARIAMYDNDKNFINDATNVYLQDGSIKITTTAEAKYVRIAILLSATGTGTINKPLFMKRKYINRLRTIHRRNTITKPRLPTRHTRCYWR